MKSATDLVKQAKQDIENLTPQQVQDEVNNGATLIDIREKEELSESGKISESVHAPRGMIEFYAGPSLPYHKKEFDPEKRIIPHCA